jgi:two-component system OmpR family sensor kinase
MSLATRLSAFFLLALAVVLLSFSGALYLLARTYLVRQLDERLQRALDTLEASVDIEPGGLEWEPADRKMELGVDAGISAVRWTVRDGRGDPVDRSANSRSSAFPSDWSPAAREHDTSDRTIFGARVGWRLAGRRLQLEELLRQGRGHPDDEPGYEVQYPVLVLVVGLAPAPMEAMLGRLGLTLGLLSAGVWAIAAATGRWLCIRALSPVSRMAKAAGAMTASDLGWRLPMPGTGDELDELGRAYNDLLDRLHDAFDRLRDAFERQRRFAGDASHQLRTPLAALLGQVQVARRRERSPEEYRRVLDLVSEEGIRLRQIVEMLLFLAQPQEGRLEAQTLDLRNWLRDHLCRWSSHPRADDLHAEVEEGPPLEVLVHIPLFAQLLDNLLENALKYSASGSPVVVRAWRERRAVALGVEDRGCGLEAEDIPRVFEPFYRAERSRRDGHPGVGLGLAVASRIAETLGGTLSVRSEHGAGSLFVLRLPAMDRAVDGNHQVADENSLHDEFPGLRQSDFL